MRWWGMLHAWGGDKCIKYCGRKAEGNSPLSKPRRIWENNIKFGVKEIIHIGVDCIFALLNTVMDPGVP